jgi:hypothetical protein
MPCAYSVKELTRHLIGQVSYQPPHVNRLFRLTSMMRLAQTCALWTLLLGPDAIMKHHASDMNEATMNSAPRYAFQYGEAWWLQRLYLLYCVSIGWIGILHTLHRPSMTFTYANQQSTSSVKRALITKASGS